MGQWGSRTSYYDVARKVDRLETEVVVPLERAVLRLEENVAELKEQVARLEKERDEG